MAKAKQDWASDKAAYLSAILLQRSQERAIARALRDAHRKGYKACEAEWKCACRRNCNRAISDSYKKGWKKGYQDAKEFYRAAK